MHLPESHGICFNAAAIQIGLNLNLKRTPSCGCLGAIKAKDIQCLTVHYRDLRGWCYLICCRTLFRHYVLNVLIVVRTELSNIISYET